MAVLIVRAAKEEVRQSSMNSNVVRGTRMDVWVKQTLDLHSGEHCSCTVSDQQSTVSYFNLPTVSYHQVHYLT